MHAFEVLESNVRSYSRSLPAIFNLARGSMMLAEDDRNAIDFLSGAGGLNYGQNNYQIQATEYLASDAVVHGLDMATPATVEFQSYFANGICNTGFNSLGQPAPTLLKLGTQSTQDDKTSFHSRISRREFGLIAVSGSRFYRTAVRVFLCGATFMPHDGYLGPDVDTADYLQKVFVGESSGIDGPAAILVETVQEEGGINLASKEWLQSSQAAARNIIALFIVDDIQMGCGRTGEFFGFEFAPALTIDAGTSIKELRYSINLWPKYSNRPERADPIRGRKEHGLRHHQI
ncbi:4-aminobutyrate aminotransferase-like enzyme [Bradyrhizobium sp. i1.7.7]